MNLITSLKTEYSEAIYRHYFPAWTGNGKNISCFAHEDNSPSLSIFQSAGEYRHHCHSCGVSGDCLDLIGSLDNIQDTGHRIGRLKDVVGISETKKKIVKTYDYTDANGKLIFQACRYEPKDFRQRRPDGKGIWIWNLQGIQLIPYNLPEVIKSEYAFLVEGEKDVESLKTLGLVATCNAQGAGKWRAEYSDHFKGKRVYILPDNDKPGRDHALQVAKGLQGIAASVKVIELPGLPEKGDVSDWIQARQSEEKTAEVINAELRQLVKAASEWQEPEPEAPAEGKQQGRLKVTGISDMLNSEPVTYLIDKILIKDTLTMLSAYAATGKSILSLAIAKAILTGNNLFDSLNVSETGPVLVIDEENPAAFIKERLEGFGFTADMQLHFLHYQGIKLDNDSLFNELAEVIKTIKPKLIIIDSLIRIHSQKENEAGMSSVMGKLRELVQTGATVLVIHHHRKGAGDIKEGIRGHSDIIGGVDMAITLEQKDDYLLLSHAKSRTVSHEPIRLELQTSGGILSYKCHGNESSDIIEVILSLLKEHPDGMKQTEILKAIKDTGDLDYGDKKIRQTLRSGEDIYWDSQKGGHTGKAIIYRVKNVMWQCGGGIYMETLPHYKKDPATLEGSESLQTLDNTKCGNAAESIKNIATLNNNPANSKKDPATLETDVIDLQFAEILP